MKHTRIAAAVLVATLGGVAASQNAVAEVTRGALMAQTCLACHGAVGTGPDATIPSLVHGFPRPLMMQAMQGFRDGTRPSTVMGRHARGYTDAEIAIIADYFDALR